MSEEMSGTPAAECGHEHSYGGVAYRCQRAPHPIDGYGPEFRHAAGIDAGYAEEIGDVDGNGTADLLTWGEDDLGDGQDTEIAWGTLADYAAGDQPKPAKVIIVTEAPPTGLDRPTDRHFPGARGWEDFDDGRLHIFGRKARRIATYAPGRWVSVREGDAILPDGDPDEAGL